MLPGPVTAGNQKSDQSLIQPVITAQKEHALHHSNAKALPEHHQLTWQQAKQTIKECPPCPPFVTPSLPLGVNPRGTSAKMLWQMDTTHCPELKLVHHSVDTFSGFTRVPL